MLKHTLGRLTDQLARHEADSAFRSKRLSNLVGQEMLSVLEPGQAEVYADLLARHWGAPLPVHLFPDDWQRWLAYLDALLDRTILPSCLAAPPAEPLGLLESILSRDPDTRTALALWLLCAARVIRTAGTSL